MLFYGDVYYPVGGFYDFIGTFDKIKETQDALDELLKKDNWGKWWQIVHTPTLKVIASSNFKTEENLNDYDNK